MSAVRALRAVPISGLLWLLIVLAVIGLAAGCGSIGERYQPPGEGMSDGLKRMGL
jgi:predicted small lipoprotein YifL